MELIQKKVHRCFAPFFPTDTEVLVQDAEIVHHLGTVLRLESGESVALVHDGREALCTIVDFAKGMRVRVNEVREVAAEPKRRLTAYIAMFKKEPFEWMLEKLTEVGVARIVPIMTDRTVRFPWKPERYQAILKAAAMQSGRGMIPELSEPMSFAQALTDAEGCATRVLFALDAPLLRGAGDDAFDSERVDPSLQKIAMFIGPEGGWTEAEILAAKKAGVVPAGLGLLTLRAETAGVVGAHRLLWS